MWVRAQQSNSSASGCPLQGIAKFDAITTLTVQIVQVVQKVQSVHFTSSKQNSKLEVHFAKLNYPAAS
jgi:hypothetical protein